MHIQLRPDQLGQQPHTWNLYPLFDQEIDAASENETGLEICSCHRRNLRHQLRFSLSVEGSKTMEVENNPLVSKPCRFSVGIGLVIIGRSPQ